MCSLKIHKVPQSIHEELVSKEISLKCDTCDQIINPLNEEFNDKLSYTQIREKYQNIGFLGV